jgi:hypothetical protein
VRSMTSRASLIDQAVTPTPTARGVLGRVPANSNQKRLTPVRVARVESATATQTQRQPRRHGQPAE